LRLADAMLAAHRERAQYRTTLRPLAAACYYSDRWLRLSHGNLIAGRQLPSRVVWWILQRLQLEVSLRVQQ
jgi:hypothetical protein